jgi:hypothetical protein
MAILTFGNTARANDSIALFNTTSTALVFGLLRSTVVNAGTAKFLTFADFDERLRGTNIHHNDLYAVNSDGVKPYLDDVAELCKLIKQGTLKVFSATLAVSGSGFTANTGMASANVGGFTIGSALATSFIGGDGSVVFS